MADCAFAFVNQNKALGRDAKAVAEQEEASMDRFHQSKTENDWKRNMKRKIHFVNDESMGPDAVLEYSTAEWQMEAAVHDGPGNKPVVWRKVHLRFHDEDQVCGGE